MFKTDIGLFKKDYRNKAFKMYHPKTGFIIQSFRSIGQLNTKKIIDSLRTDRPDFIAEKLRYLTITKTDCITILIFKNAFCLFIG